MPASSLLWGFSLWPEAAKATGIVIHMDDSS
jgi:hypothetical protein